MWNSSSRESGEAKLLNCRPSSRCSRMDRTFTPSPTQLFDRVHIASLAPLLREKEREEEGRDSMKEKMRNRKRKREEKRRNVTYIKQ